MRFFPVVGERAERMAEHRAGANRRKFIGGRDGGARGLLPPTFAVGGRKYHSAPPDFTVQTVQAGIPV